MINEVEKLFLDIAREIQKLLVLKGPSTFESMDHEEDLCIGMRPFT